MNINTATTAAACVIQISIYFTTILATDWLSFSSDTRTATVASPGARSTCTRYSCSIESVRRVVGSTTVQSLPLTEYSALPRVLSAVLRMEANFSSFAPAGAAASAVISGAVLSIRNGSLSAEVVNAWSGGLDGASGGADANEVFPIGERCGIPTVVVLVDFVLEEFPRGFVRAPDLDLEQHGVAVVVVSEPAADADLSLRVRQRWRRAGISLAGAAVEEGDALWRPSAGSVSEGFDEEMVLEGAGNL